MPSFSTYTVAQPHTALPWNGVKGGVFAVITTGALNISSTVDVTGKGFRGGTSSAQFSGIAPCPVTAYASGFALDSFALKGEGIAEVSSQKSAGCGKLANAGGGGGSNAGTGGAGGNNHQGSCANTPPVPGTTQGVGGLALTYNNSVNRIFLGGGGGAGHAQTNTAAAGGAGGGIVIIQAGGGITASGSAQILANGAPGASCTPAGSQFPCHAWAAAAVAVPCLSNLLALGARHRGKRRCGSQ